MDFTISLRQVDLLIGQLKSMEAKLTTEILELYLIYQTLKRTEDTAMLKVAMKLKKQITSLENQKNDVTKLWKALQKIVNLYKTYEKNVASYEDHSSSLKHMVFKVIPTPSLNQLVREYFTNGG